jgi:hypothetical protein
MCGLSLVAACGTTPNRESGDAEVDARAPLVMVMHDAGSSPLRDAGSSTKSDAGPARDASVPKDSGPAPADAHVNLLDANSQGADAGHADSGAGAAACAGLFCENFESGSLNSSVWTRTETSKGNSATVQGTQKAHGQYAAQFHAKGGSSYSMIFLEKLPAALEKHYFGRLYYYASGFPTESGGHTAYITSSNTLAGFPDNDHHLEVSSYYDKGGTWQMTYWQGDGPEYIGSGGQIPKAQWFCLEWEFNDTPDQIAVWVDGDGSTRGASFRNINNHASGLLGKMTTLGLGFRTWHPMGAPDIDIYIDDIVLDTARVGCLP